MWARLGDWWRHKMRVAASGLCFFCLGLGGVSASLLLFPLMRRVPQGKGAFQAKVRRLIRGFFRMVVTILDLAGVMKVECLDWPDPQAFGGRLVLANHPSYLDVVVLIALLPEAVCVVKGEIWDNPFFGGIVRAAGYVPAHGPEDVVEGGSRALAEGKTLIIFPEGTRSLPGLPFHFHRGAAHIALRSGAGLLPLVITCDPPLLTKHQRWYHMPRATSRLRVRVRPLLDLQALCEAGHPPPKAARQLTEALETYFTRELHGTEHHAA